MAEPNTIGDVIQTIVQELGEQKLLNSQIVLATFSDLAPTMKKERALLNSFLQCDGMEKLLKVKNASRQEQRSCIESLVYKLRDERWVEEKAAYYVCAEVYRGITGKKWLFDTPIKKDTSQQTKTAEPPVNLDAYKSVTIQAGRKKQSQQIAVHNGDRTIEVLIPSDVADGQTLRFAQQGRRDPETDCVGDLYITIHIISAPQGRPWGPIVAAVAVVLLLLCIRLIPGKSPDDPGGSLDADVHTQNQMIGHVHSWQDADCISPKTCKTCGETSGTAIGHQWRYATYQNPQTCCICSSVQGEPLVLPWEQEPPNTATGIISVSPGGWSTYVLTDSGRVFAIGRNQDGQNNVSRWSDIIAISGGDRHVVVLHADGTVDAIGRNEQGQCEVDGWRNIVSVSAGVFCTVGICEDGNVRLAGKSTKAALDVSGWSNIVQVDIGDHFIVGLRSDGTVVATGANEYGQCDVYGWTDIIAVAVGETHTVGLRSDGTVVSAGNRTYGACDVSQWNDIIQISAGKGMTVGLRRDGTVVVAGAFTDQDKISAWSGTIHTPESWRNVIQIATRYNQIFGLTKDGYVVACGFNTHDQCDVDALHKIVLSD